MSWIQKTGVGIDPTRHLLTLGNKTFPYQQLAIPNIEGVKSSVVTMYEDQRIVIPVGGKAKLAVAPFEQGDYGGMQFAELKAGLSASLPLYTPSSDVGEVKDWDIHNVTTKDLVIQLGQKVGTWKAARQVEGLLNKASSSYFVAEVPDLIFLVSRNVQHKEKLALLLEKWRECFLVNK